MELQSIKQRFDIVGDDPALNRALDIAIQVAGTDLSVVVYGESGVGKEAIPQIIHQNSSRKHASYIAVNCGAIPEGTIDSELFGHEKGSFTGANETRKGYFEVADGGTIFLDHQRHWRWLPSCAVFLHTAVDRLLPAPCGGWRCARGCE